MVSRDRILAANDATYAAWNAHDPDAVAAVFATDAELVDVMANEMVRGRDAIRDRAAQILAGFPDFHLERRALLIDGAANADHWLMTGTHTGEYAGLPPTNRTVQVRGSTFSEFADDGLVTRDTHFIDIGALLRQLGLR
jgi:steroid delta-isomerase-like uncharacterized protein